MQQIYERVAGLDVHRDNVVACVRRLGPRGGLVFEKDRFTTTTAGLRELEAWLGDRQVELVALRLLGSLKGGPDEPSAVPRRGILGVLDSPARMGYSSDKDGVWRKGR